MLRETLTLWHSVCSASESHSKKVVYSDEQIYYEPFNHEW